MLLEGVIKMDEILEKIDQIIVRTGASYAEARDALEKHGGDVVDALIYLEKREKSPERKMMDQGKNLLNEFQEIIRHGGGTKIQVQKNGRSVAEIPAALGFLGLAGALTVPGVAAIGAIGSVAAMMQKYTLEIKKVSNERTGEHDLADMEKNIDN